MSLDLGFRLFCLDYFFVIVGVFRFSVFCLYGKYFFSYFFFRGCREKWSGKDVNCLYKGVEFWGDVGFIKFFRLVLNL